MLNLIVLSAFANPYNLHSSYIDEDTVTVSWRSDTIWTSSPMSWGHGQLTETAYSSVVPSGAGYPPLHLPDPRNNWVG